MTYFACTARWASLALVAGIGIACTRADVDSEGAGSDLIGGRLADDAEFPATLQMIGSCTAAKVGPRHILTAAHCNAYGNFRVGGFISLTSAKRVGTFADAAADLPGKAYTIERFEVEPGWLEKCGPSGTTCGSVHVSGRGATIADAALIVTTEDITGIPDAAIDLSPLEAGDKVVLTGYGCEEAVGGNWSYLGSRLRVASTRAVAFAETIHTGSFISESDRETLAPQMAAVYGITPGPSWALRGAVSADGGGLEADAGSVESDAGRVDQPDGGGSAQDPSVLGGLCPGDSGGPLYRDDGAGLTIVGINANYTFATGLDYSRNGISFRYGGSPVTNWHTRVDAESGLKVGEWLKSLGVNVTCTRGGC